MIKSTRRVFPALFFVLALGHAALAAQLPAGFTDRQVAAGLPGGTAMAFAPDGRLFVCQQDGRLRVIKNGVLLPEPFLTVTTDPSGERGLLGLAFDPEFASNGFVYVYYTATTTPRHNRISRFTADGDRAAPGSETLVFRLDDLSARTNHNGGAMHFGPDGKLYVAVGENASPQNSQSLDSLLGKMLRINRDGSIPADNPFFNTAAGARRAVWALGLRNPFTFAFQPGSSRLFINDVGENTREEINEGAAGANYGWPASEGPTTNPAHRSPVFAYPHGSGPESGCAITGGAFYNPAVAQFPASFAGKYFFADFCGGWIRALDPSTRTAEGFATGLPTPVDLKVAPDGSLYYLARGDQSVHQIFHTGPPPANTVRLGAAGYAANEGDGRVVVTIVREGDLAGAGSVEFATQDGTASERTDYVPTFRTLRFAPNESSKTVEVLLTGGAVVEGEESFTVSLSNARGAFVTAAPAAATVVVRDDDTAPPAANPIDEADFFVRQHYHDFLGRDPDEGGLRFWSNLLAGCGADAGCVERRRVQVSAAFFLSIEFQETGYLVHRLTVASFGRQPRFHELLRDARALAEGVVVGQGDWRGQLEANRRAFLEEFVARAEFAAAFPAELTAAEFVARLASRTGDSLSQAERDSLATRLGAGELTRAAALYEVAEDADFRRAEFNRAFVLMEYFGYLRRNPDDAPDTNLDGYNFWLGQLDRFGGDYERAEMVRAFITSIEYRRRFGP